MRISAPISSVGEIEAVVTAGANEIYFGLVPEEWKERFGELPVNRRNFGNLHTYQDLQSAVKTAHSLGIPVALALNQQQYTSEQIGHLLRVAERFALSGGESVIVSDIGLLTSLTKENFGLRIHISSIANCRNSEAAAFYHELGASRIIVPRYATLDEIKQMISSASMLEYELFVLNDACLYEEGTCLTLHLPYHLGGPICTERYIYRYNRVDGKDLSEDEIVAFRQNDDDYDLWRWYKFSCGFTVTEQGYPYGPCGTCAIPYFDSLGVTTVKVAGREAPLTRKLKSVEVVKSVLDQINSRRNIQEIVSTAQKLRNRPDYCSSRYMCYYPDVHEHLRNFPSIPSNV